MDKLIYQLPDDLINKIYSFVLYKQSENLLIEIKNYYIKKVYINLFYKTILQNWSYCFIEPLYHIFYYHYIDIINKKIDLNNFEDWFNFQMNYAEIFRILNKPPFLKKKLIKKYIFKYILKMPITKIIDLWFDFIGIWGRYTNDFNDNNDFLYEVDTSLNYFNNNYINYLIKYVPSPKL